MSAAETIAAAIGKLEALRDESDSEGSATWDVQSPATGELTMTLWRTIDVQLAILRVAQRMSRHAGMDLTLDEPNLMGYAVSFYRESVNLARAILGEATA